MGSLQQVCYTQLTTLLQLPARLCSIFTKMTIMFCIVESWHVNTDMDM